MSLTVTTRQLTDAAAIDALGVTWDNLLAEAASDIFFLTRAFQSAWWAELGEGELRVLVGDGGGDRPLFIAPLYLSQVDGLGRTLRLVGGGEVADYLDLIAPAAALPSAWAEIIERLAADDDWQALDLRALPAWSPSRTIVPALAADRGWTVETMRDEVCPLIRLPGRWEDYLAGLRKKDRHELRRKIGRLERLANDERFTIVGEGDDLPAAVADFLTLHRKSGAEKDGFWTPQLEAFFARLMRAAHGHGWLRLAIQRIDGAPAAAVLAFRYGDRYYAYNSGYDPAYRDLGAGVVCMARTIQAAIAEGATVFDLLQGDEPYKYDFGAVDTEVYRCVVRRPAS